jgi:hypothetical protein
MKFKLKLPSYLRCDNVYRHSNHQGAMTRTQSGDCYICGEAFQLRTYEQLSSSTWNDRLSMTRGKSGMLYRVQRRSSTRNDRSRLTNSHRNCNFKFHTSLAEPSKKLRDGNAM